VIAGKIPLRSCALLGLTSLAGILFAATPAGAADPAGESVSMSQCIQEELALPEVAADMYWPGKHSQSTSINITYPDATNCNGITGRNGNFQVFLQDGLHSKRIYKLFSFRNNLFPYTSNEGGVGSGISLTPIHDAQWQTYHCRKGPATTQAWVQPRQQAIDPVTHRVLAQKVYKVRVVIHLNHGKGC
jgi:hypothetical protein